MKTTEDTLVLAEPDHSDSTAMLEDENNDLKWREYPFALRSREKLQLQDAQVKLVLGRSRCSDHMTLVDT